MPLFHHTEVETLKATPVRIATGEPGLPVDRGERLLVLGASVDQTFFHCLHPPSKLQGWVPADHVRITLQDHSQTGQLSGKKGTGPIRNSTRTLADMGSSKRAQQQQQQPRPSSASARSKARDPNWDKNYEEKRKKEGKRGHGINLLKGQQARFQGPYSEAVDRVIQSLIDAQPLDNESPYVMAFTSGALEKARSSLDGYDATGWRVWLKDPVWVRFNLVRDRCAPQGATVAEFIEMMLDLARHGPGGKPMPGGLDMSLLEQKNALKFNLRASLLIEELATATPSPILNGNSPSQIPQSSPSNSSVSPMIFSDANPSPLLRGIPSNPSPVIVGTTPPMSISPDVNVPQPTDFSFLNINPHEDQMLSDFIANAIMSTQQHGDILTSIGLGQDNPLLFNLPAQLPSTWQSELEQIEFKWDPIAQIETVDLVGGIFDSDPLTGNYLPTPPTNLLNQFNPMPQQPFDAAAEGFKPQLFEPPSLPGQLADQRHRWGFQPYFSQRSVGSPSRAKAEEPSTPIDEDHWAKGLGPPDWDKLVSEEPPIDAVPVNLEVYKAAAERKERGRRWSFQSNYSKRSQPRSSQMSDTGEEAAADDRRERKNSLMDFMKSRRKSSAPSIHQTAPPERKKSAPALIFPSSHASDNADGSDVPRAVKEEPHEDAVLVEGMKNVAISVTPPEYEHKEGDVRTEEEVLEERRTAFLILGRLMNQFLNGEVQKMDSSKSLKTVAMTAFSVGWLFASDRVDESQILFCSNRLVGSFKSTPVHPTTVAFLARLVDFGMLPIGDEGKLDENGDVAYEYEDD
ncbi:hypothetical protein HK101_008395 [Irineochytrium annulatum]|nr:hypothetical protein HK101_008395 [Irineochytrium annulatum]